MIISMFWQESNPHHYNYPPRLQASTVVCVTLARETSGTYLSAKRLFWIGAKNMIQSLSKWAGLVSLGLCMSSTLGFAVSAADMIEPYGPRHSHVDSAHYKPVQSAHANSSAIDLSCGRLTYRYQYPQAHTELKTVCSPPWTKPSTNDY